RVLALRNPQRLREDGAHLFLVPVRVARGERAHPQVQVGASACVGGCGSLERQPPDRQAPPKGGRGAWLRLADGGGTGGGVLQEGANDGRQLVCSHIEGVVATQIRGEDRPGLVAECPHLVEARDYDRHAVRTLPPQMSP